MSKVRIPNLSRDRWTDDARKVFSFWGEPGSWEGGSRTNTQMVMANHPALGIAFNNFGKQVLLESTCPIRPRELAILRLSWHLKSEYEWHYHVGYAIAAGLTAQEVAAIPEGPDSPTWDGKPQDRAVLIAIDELRRDSAISDTTWDALSDFLDTKQLMDFVFTAGHYVMFGWAISAFGIPLEEGVDKIGFDLKTASGRKPAASFRPGETDDWAEQSGV